MPIIDIENSNLSRDIKDKLITEITQHPEKESEIIENLKLELEQNITDFYKEVGITD